MGNAIASHKDFDLMNIPDSLKGIEPATAASYRDAIRLYYRYVEDHNLAFGFESVQAWLKDLPAATSNIRYYAIKKCLLQYYRNHPQLGELIENLNSIKKVRLDKSVKECDYLSLEQVEALTTGASERIGLMIQALFWTGCRISELIHIRLSDCDIQDVVTITIIGKGKKQRDVYLGRDLYEKIREVFRGSTWLFEKSTGELYHRIYISNRIKHYADRILGVKASAHTLRHSKAMFLKDVRGLTPDQIARALGHSSVVTTLEHYFHGTPGPEEQGII